MRNQKQKQKTKKHFYNEKNFWYGYIITLFQIPGLVFISYFFVYRIMNILLKLNNELSNMKIETTDNVTVVYNQLSVYQGLISDKLNEVTLLAVVFIFLSIIIFSISKTFSIYFFRKHLNINKNTKKYIKHSFLFDFSIGLIFSFLLFILLVVMFGLIKQGTILSPVVWILFLVIGMFLLLFMELFSHESHNKNIKSAINSLIKKFKKSWKQMILYVILYFIYFLFKVLLIIIFLLLFKFNMAITLLFLVIFSLLISVFLAYLRLRTTKLFQHVV